METQSRQEEQDDEEDLSSKVRFHVVHKTQHRKHHFKLISYDSDTTKDRRWKATTKSIFVFLSLLAPLLLLPVGHASSVFLGSGGFSPTGQPTNITTSQVGNYLITHETFGLAFSGTFTGTTIGKVTIIVNLSTGTGIFFGVNSFTGTVTTATGTASGTVQSPFAASFVGNNFQGRFSLFGGTGGLTNLEGQGTIQGTLNNFVGTYTASLTHR